MVLHAEELKASKTRLLAQCSEGGGISNFQEQYTEIMDQYFRRSLQESSIGPDLFKNKNPFAFVSLGGYGRKELCLHSDIDIMILFTGRIPARAKDLAEEVLFPLWDLGLDLGYGIRNLKDCLSLARKDFEVLTSLLDARFICGDSPLYFALMKNIQKRVISKRSTAFGRWLEDQNKIRMAAFGDASHLLEPDLKEGIGGLRDYHHMLWLARVFFGLSVPRDLEYMGLLSHREYQDLETHRQFILKVRNELHRLSGRKNDRLIFDFQEEIAKKLAYGNRRGFLAVEQFMGHLHTSMYTIKSLHQTYLSTHLPKPRVGKKKFQDVGIAEGLRLDEDQIGFDSPKAILSNPLLLMEIFEQSARLGLPLSQEARRLVREFLYLAGETFLVSETAAGQFLNIMQSPNTLKALDQMFETGFLCAYIPEFEQIKDRVQFDSYHIYPVARHVLETVRYLKTLDNEKEVLLLTVFSDLSNPEALFLAGLLHDIGRTGEDHSRRGVTIARKILKRLGYERDATEDILFLIRHHLLLAETATRRDLNDEKVIVQCASTIGNVDRLKMLFLLTWADSRATGPRAWNDWIANLVQELFFKILHTLEGGQLATPDATRRARQTLSRVHRDMAKNMDPDGLEKLLEAMSPRYILETHPQDMLRHLEMFRGFQKRRAEQDPDTFALEAEEKESEGCWEITFMGKDRPGLFSSLSGVLALRHINILSAHIYTWRDGTVLDRFMVTGPLDPIHPEETWEQIRTDLGEIFQGRLSLDRVLGQKATPSVLSKSHKPTHRPDVVMDTESSDFFTLIEVFANDRVGLLYQITRTLFELDLDIRIAKISTKADQVADIFYVRDLEGQKIEDEKKLQEIREALLTILVS